MTAAARPADVAATANSVAVVVLATPPFWDAMTSVFMDLRIWVDTRLLVCLRQDDASTRLNVHSLPIRVRAGQAQSLQVGMISFPSQFRKSAPGRELELLEMVR
jgi:hypothetical protein